MFYLMKDDKEVMEYGITESIIYEKELLPEELRNIHMYNVQVLNEFELRTDSYKETFNYLLSFFENSEKYNISNTYEMLEILAKK